MGLFDMLKDVAGKAVGDALSQGVKKVVTNTATHAANQAVDVAATKVENAVNAEVDKVADKYREEAAPAAEGAKSSSGSFAEAIESLKKVDGKQIAEAFSVLGGLAKSVAENTKVCPKCGTPVAPDGEFCPSCGTRAVSIAEAEGIDVGKEISQSFSGSGRYSEATVASFGEEMPNEPNMYNFGGSPESYFTDIFKTEFAGYDLKTSRGYGGKTTVFTLYKGADTAIVVELLPDSSDSKKLGEKCRAQGIPYLRYYFGHDGWWNTRRYVVERTKNAIRI